jgi:hypothetical protein
MAVNGWTVMKEVLERKKVEKGMKVRLKIVKSLIILSNQFWKTHRFKVVYLYNQRYLK